MAPVDVGVAQQDDLVVTDLGDVELVAYAGADGSDQGLDLVVLEHPVQPGPLDVEDLPPDGEDGLGLRVSRLDRRSSGRVTLDYEQLGPAPVPGRAVAQFLGH